MSGSKRTAVALGTSAMLAVGGLLMIGQPAGAQTSTKGVTFQCKFENAPGAAVTFAPEVTLDAPDVVALGATGDLSATFANNLIAQLPDAADPGAPEGAELVLGIAGGPGGPVTLTAAASAGSGGTVNQTGPFAGGFTPAGAGEHTVTSITLVVKFAGDDWVCTAGAPGFAAIKVEQKLVQTANAPTVPGPSSSSTDSASPSASSSATESSSRPPSTSLTQTVSGSVKPSSSSTSTDAPLPNTGSSNNGVIAFAMLAGTAVLGALAVILSMPARRRRRQAAV